VVEGSASVPAATSNFTHIICTEKCNHFLWTKTIDGTIEHFLKRWEYFHMTHSNLTVLKCLARAVAKSHIWSMPAFATTRSQIETLWNMSASYQPSYAASNYLQDHFLSYPSSFVTRSEQRTPSTLLFSMHCARVESVYWSEKKWCTKSDQCQSIERHHACFPNRACRLGRFIASPTGA
jgi:hypothetical protein